MSKIYACTNESCLTYKNETPAPTCCKCGYDNEYKREQIPLNFTPGKIQFPQEATLSDLEGKHVDVVNHPSHYTNHPSGIECIQITEHMNFNLGNALKYIWRADLKGKSIEDLEKAIWYVKREIELRSKK